MLYIMTIDFKIYNINPLDVFYRPIYQNYQLKIIKMNMADKLRMRKCQKNEEISKFDILTEILLIKNIFLKYKSTHK